MAIKRVMAVRDRAANTFAQPFYVSHIGQAIRSFQDEINRAAPDNVMHAHPDDFDLFHLADFDDITGGYNNVKDGPNQVAIGKQLKASE